MPRSSPHTAAADIDRRGEPGIVRTDDGRPIRRAGSQLRRQRHPASPRGRRGDRSCTPLPRSAHAQIQSPRRGVGRRADRGLARRLGRLRLESPRGTQHPQGSDGRQHRRVRLHGAGRSGQPDGRRELDPARGAGRRPELRPAGRERQVLRQDRQHRRRPRGRRVPLGLRDQVPQPELVPVRRSDGRLGQRSGPQLRPDVRPLQGEVQQEGRARQDEADRHDAPVVPDNVGPKTIPNFAKVEAAASPRSRAAARRSSARPTTRSSSTSARSSTASTSTSPAGRTSASATRAAARTTSRATTRSRSSCRCPSARSRATASRSPGMNDNERRRRRVVDDRAPERLGARGTPWPSP